MIRPSSSIVTVFVQGEYASSERRLDRSWTIAEVKEKLGPIVGVPVSTMSIVLVPKGAPNNESGGIALSDDNSYLGAFAIEDFSTLKVIDTNPYKIKNEFSDLSRVEKYEMSQEEYEKRNDSVRAWKERNKLGRFGDPSESVVKKHESYKAASESIKQGDRCQVLVDNMMQRGAVFFVGETEFKPGFWVGIELDEPVGKHNGTVQGKEYFKCREKHGIFLRPDAVTVGDFPEESYDDIEEL